MQLSKLMSIHLIMARCNQEHVLPAVLCWVVLFTFFMT